MSPKQYIISAVTEETQSRWQVFPKQMFKRHKKAKIIIVDVAKTQMRRSIRFSCSCSYVAAKELISFALTKEVKEEQLGRLSSHI